MPLEKSDAVPFAGDVNGSAGDDNPKTLAVTGKGLRLGVLAIGPKIDRTLSFNLDGPSSSSSRRFVPGSGGIT